MWERWGMCMTRRRKNVCVGVLAWAIVTLCVRVCIYNCVSKSFEKVLRTSKLINEVNKRSLICLTCECVMWDMCAPFWEGHSRCFPYRWEQGWDHEGLKGKSGDILHIFPYHLIPLQDHNQRWTTCIFFQCSQVLIQFYSLLLCAVDLP